MKNHRSFFIFILPVIVIFSLFLASCTETGEVISKPDEFKRIFDASETIVIQSIAQVFKDKGFGDVTISPGRNVVESGYLIQDDWRSKSIARVNQINWKECEVTLSVITEKKTSHGWEMRRLLEEKQYDTFFDAIELQLYNNLYKAKEGRLSP